MDNENYTLKKEAIRICGIYFLIGILWIYFSDRLSEYFFKNKSLIVLVSTYKGIFYVLITTAILYTLLKRLLKKADYAEKKLNESYNQLSAINQELQEYVKQVTESDEELRQQYNKILEYDKELNISEKKYKTLITQMQLGLALYAGNEADDLLDYVLTDLNESHERITGFVNNEIIGKKFSDIHSQMEQENLDKLRNTILSGEPSHYERYQKRNNKFYEIIAYRPKNKQLAIIINDITKRKELEERLQYLSYHDQLTGLYNRTYFDQEIKRFDIEENLPFTITMGDINGLKLINDSFGHAFGDVYINKISEVLNKAYRRNDIIFRLGGDEFVILSPNTDGIEAEKLLKKFKWLAKKEEIHSLEISISFGFATKCCITDSTIEIMKKAEDFMYKKKLLESPSMRGKAIHTIITTLHEKNAREELHSRRVSELCENMGCILGMHEDEIRELKMVGLLHDIGKVAIEERILNKNGRLSTDEWEEIKKHPEIGYRILSTVNHMSEMAEYVLAHHERWDGSGYPKGLKGEEIPIVSRIIAIADAYDAMISERSYRSALSKEYAIMELKKYSGIQFCPELVELFIAKLLKEAV